MVPCISLPLSWVPAVLELVQRQRGDVCRCPSGPVGAAAQGTGRKEGGKERDEMRWRKSVEHSEGRMEIAGLGRRGMDG
ncbi:hypothetical protein PR048_024549 [Dryococelus australis]|uniref:Uncharacterized protein n=1 Tax=Dryococelus australis TaxID=614101 RepID=A0ABQ9GNX0_9NEOP|nr:hypothetical protein PR048_024549 [Dryococelus australis]